ncbi:hypothetical protein Bca52824_074795 [Brassica carinata]|uniref:Uncharacterized protein n=1 Tax=Brassica carinata TaxID=52824 RepID=A0A8X7TXB8_BRACI|nr:hypothetical protein Bca52824_074795 [Brassica carinata]
MALRQHISSPMTKSSRRHVRMVSERSVAAPVCSSITMASVPPPHEAEITSITRLGLGDLHQLQHGKAPPVVSFDQDGVQTTK